MNTLIHKAVKVAAFPLGPTARSSTGDIAALLYHKVGEGSREIDLPLPQFADQLAYIARAKKGLSLDQALTSTSEGVVVVTVDDGFSDFYENVVPAAVAHHIPVLLYLATGWVAGPKHIGVPNGERPMTWSQLRDATGTGLVTVGAHTHTHVDLSHADEAVARREMTLSRDLIEQELGVACRHFAYPWAVASDAAQAVAEELFTTIAVGWHTNRGGRTDPLRLGRTPIFRSDGPMYFRAKVGGRLDGEARMFKAMRRGPWRKSR